MADYTTLDGKVLGGQGGDGVLIEQLAFKIDADPKTKEETAYVEIMGVAYTSLKDPWNPAAGYDDLPEPVPVKDMVKVAVAEGKKDDNQILFESINRQFNLNNPLVDSPNAWERFTQDGQDSVHDEIVGKPAYFRAKKGNGKTGDKLSEYFFNLIALAKRKEAKMAAVKDEIAAIFKKRAQKKEAKEKADAEFAGTVATEPIPF